MRQKHKRVARPEVLLSVEGGYIFDAFGGGAVFKSYTANKGSASNSGIKCSVRAVTGSYTNTRKVSYRMSSTKIDCEAVRRQGRSKLKFFGTYSVASTAEDVNITAGTSTNVYSAFIGLFSDVSAIVVDNTGITNADAIYQVTENISGEDTYLYYDCEKKSGVFAGAIDLPESGTMSLIVGALQQNLRAETILNLSGIWIE